MAGKDWKEWETFFNSRTVDSYAAYLVPNIKADSHIIDVGCGAGNLTIDFARKVPQGRVVGVDHSERSIATARAAAEKADVSNVEFVVDDAETLSLFDDDTFDIAHAHQVMIHLPKPVNALGNMRRVVKPGGTVAVRDLVYQYQNTSSTIRDNWDKMWRDSRQRGAMGYGTGAMTHEWMHQAGFQWQDVRTGVCAFEYDRSLLPIMIPGFLSWATDRGESEEYKKTLERELETWVQEPSARSIWLDGWSLGLKV